MTFAWYHPSYYKNLEEGKKRNPIAETLPQYRHKRFKDKTKYSRNKVNYNLSQESSQDNEQLF